MYTQEDINRLNGYLAAISHEKEQLKFLEIVKEQFKSSDKELKDCVEVRFTNHSEGRILSVNPDRECSEALVDLFVEWSKNIIAGFEKLVNETEIVTKKESE